MALRYDAARQVASGQRAGTHRAWALPPGGDDSARLQSKESTSSTRGGRASRKRGMPCLYAERDENGELPDEKEDTGPSIDRSFLHVPTSVNAASPEWIAFDSPAARQPLPSTLEVTAIFRRHGRLQQYVPWLLVSESARQGEKAMISIREDAFPPPLTGWSGLLKTLVCNQKYHIWV